jgi:hypothetical protein
MIEFLTALIAATTLTIATSTVPTTEHARCIGCAVDAGERPADAPPGYVYYPYGEPLPGPNCYWYRMPVYDTYGNMVGWRGASSGVLLLVIRLSSVATALTANQPRRLIHIIRRPVSQPTASMTEREWG